MFRLTLVFAFIFISLTASSQTYYIVRHAEKAVVDGNPNMTANDPPLTEAGVARAMALKALLKDEKIGYIFSTNTLRTRSTAEPLSRHIDVPVEIYNPRPDASFIQKLRSLDKNVLIVGHSNTIDDIVNMLCNEQKVAADVDEKIYDNLFIVTIDQGKVSFVQKKY